MRVSFNLRRLTEGGIKCKGKITNSVMKTSDLQGYTLIGSFKVLKFRRDGAGRLGREVLSI
jgi:hypothetical protein